MELTVIATGSSGNCYVLESSHSALILECGVAPEKLMTGTTLAMSKVAGVLVSHEHGDHAGFAARYAGLGLPLYMSYGTAEALAVPYHPLYPGGWHTLAGGFQVYAFRVQHDAAEPMGFIIRHNEMGLLMFLTDTCASRYSFRKWSIDHIMVEANYDDALVDEGRADGSIPQPQAARLRSAHMSIRDAIELVRIHETAALRTVTLIHLSAQNADRRAFQRRMQDAVMFADVRVARPGLVRTLNPANVL